MKSSDFVTTSAYAWRAGTRLPVISVLSLFIFATGLFAQRQVVPDLSRNRVLAESGSQASALDPLATLTGIVRDARGALLPDAAVTLMGRNEEVHQVVKTDTSGSFTFTKVPPGTYKVRIESPGLQTFLSSPVIVTAAESLDLPQVEMQIPTKVSTVDVTATPNEVAQAQVKEEEQQRILGVLPNFYTSYIWDAEPLTPKLKFKLALRTTIDPVTFLVAGALAGLEQRNNTFPRYGQGDEAYARRCGAAYADELTSKMFGSAMFPMLFHQDPRYFYQGSGSAGARLRYALISTFRSRGDKGQAEFNYSRVFGAFAAAGLSNAYRSAADRSVGSTLQNGLIIIAGGAMDNLLREFLSRKLTHKVPSFANGKP